MLYGMKRNLPSTYQTPLRCKDASAPSITLSAYVSHRLGRAPQSQAINFLTKPFCAPTFTQFWWYWNPVFGYYLYFQCYRPVRKFLPRSMSVLVTFIFCGIIHDLPFNLVAALHGDRPASFTLTTMFMLLGLIVVLTEAASVSFSSVPVKLRWVIHLVNIFLCWRLALYLTTAA